MERIKSFISPRTRRKKLELAGGDTGINIIPTTTPHKTFGVDLEQLMSRAPPAATVPFVVSRLCEYIYRYGLDSVGLFRVSGSVRVVERMRMQFELMGDVNLEEENDVAASAGLLRVFLRDLPDTLVPGRLTNNFFSAVQNSELNKDVVLSEMKKSLGLLPEENYNMLKYICSLLVVVAQNEADNKMSPFSLAILFGPNIFKYELTSGMGGLRDMDSSKDVMHLFISEYDTLFAEDGDPSPQEFWAKHHKRKSPPPRPPPPKVQSLPSFTSPSAESITATLTSSASSSSLDYRPIPSPRKIKNVYDSSSGSEIDGRQTPTSVTVHHPVPLFSPRDDIDHSRAHSPFALESETHSIIESPMITARTNEFVEKTIEETISEHIFGMMDFNQNSGSQSPRSPQKTTFEDIEVVDNFAVSVPVAKPRTMTNTRTSGSSGGGGGSGISAQAMADNAKDFDDVARSEMLTGHKKPVGPPRRTPSRKHRRSWEPDRSAGPSTRDGNTMSVIVPNGSPQPPSNRSLNHLQADRDKENEGGYGEEGLDDQECGSPTVKPKNMRRHDSKALALQSPSVENSQEPSSNQQSPASSGSALSDRSPSNGIKLFIPPLDLTTLHEHVDGVEAIPVSQEQSDTQMWIKTNLLSGPEDTDVAIISPRSHKLKKKNGSPALDMPISVVTEAPMSPSAYFGSGLFRASMNTDIPPSPPIQQDLYKKHSDDEGSHRLRQLTKKIQGFKKKIKSFEERFEKEHGYKPSQGERAAQPDIKKYMSELSKARKDLKRLKEDTEKVNRSRHNSGASSSGMELSPPETPTVETTLDFILGCLKEKRHEAGRPEEVMLMSREEVQEEKLAVQRALLHFEGLHGRPTTREEKDLMRPLYDRYRSVKRMLAKPMSPRNSLELQTVPEDQMIEIPRSFTRNPVRVPTASSEEDAESRPSPDVGTMEFGLVTRDLTILRELDLPTSQDKGLQQTGGGGKDWQGEGGWEETSARSEDSGGDAHLHELSLSELHTEIETSRGKKKKLRRILREFEEEFLDKNGRKVQKEDRYPLQTEYNDYKKVKARLRLLEALVLKHHE